MEHNEVSPHEVKVFLALSTAPSEWLSNRDIAARVKGVTLRTVRAHTYKLVKLGLVDQAELFPGHRFRVSDKAEKRNKTYTQRIMQAAEIMGLH